MSDPYRTASFIEQPRCTEHGCTYPSCVTCGHPHDAHRWWNSEFLDCGAAGYFNESVVNGVWTKHQRMAHCRCERYRDRAV